MPVECPRCDVLGTPIKRKDGYIYVRHRSAGKTHFCYIGPIEGYKLISKLHNIIIGHAFSIDNKISF